VGLGFIPPCVCVCVSVFCVHDISKTDAARITKLDMEMFHDESRTRIYFGMNQKVKGQGHELQKHCDVGICTFVSAGFF